MFYISSGNDGVNQYLHVVESSSNPSFVKSITITGDVLGQPLGKPLGVSPKSPYSAENPKRCSVIPTLSVIWISVILMSWSFGILTTN